MSNNNVSVNNRDYAPESYAPESYAQSGEIMLISVTFLFTIVFLLYCIHLYARWSLGSHQRHYNLHHRRTRNRPSHLVFTSNVPSSYTTFVVSRGLDASVLNSLPTFVYSTSTSTHEHVLECAVCLSEFEENEKGRLLPNCNHSFHIDCIDMWFHSHSTCPLCRSPVKPDFPVPPPTETQVEIDVDSAESELGTNSELGREMGCASSSSSPSKGLEIVNLSIEMPRRNESFKGLEEELQGFKSPGKRILALKRILSRERKAFTPSMSCSSATEIDLEKGDQEETQAPSRRGKNDDITGV